MILRRALGATSPWAARSSPRPLRRFISTQVESIESSAQSSLKQLQSTHAQLNAEGDQSIAAVDTETHGTFASATASVAEEYHHFKQLERQLKTLGADIEPHYKPHTLLNHPPSPADVTLELLLASEAHQGHVTSLWNPANARYIHGIRQGVHIISLEVTAAHLRRAAKVVQEVSRRGGMVLFVGTRDGQDRAVARAAELAKGYHLFERWIPGSITNGQQILGRCKTKVVNELDEEVPGFEEQLYDRSVLRPDLVVCLNPLENYVLLHECALNNIPTIGVIDTNADPTWVTYPIPANDDSLRCIQVIAGVLGRAGEAGQKQRLAAAANGTITYQPAKGLVMPETEEEAEAAVKKAAKSNSRTSRREAADQPGVNEDIINTDELAKKLDDVNNREDHRVRGGRDLKASA
ncbi:37S ribosomal protein MRP4, mitochondrial precursor [Paraphoma chrysanthemicola]|uniref:37S ribosomal protein MRP4, mitochondrial n=1 Tax=Paraphoma chrysanthemicola TaxID=798071 RepID=A0A8K0RJL1_9PLEO|nr:37S ribosomal protein MRP4, mitochondrial precursor [Paraphoma chrysanthemicola]